MAEGIVPAEKGTVPPLIYLASLTVTDNTAEIYRTSGKNNINSAEYDIYRNDVLLTSTGSFVYSDTGLSPETSYRYFIKAKDTAGNALAEL